MEPLFEEVRQLGKKIAFYTTKQDDRRVDNSLIRSDLTYGLAYLYAEILFHAQDGLYYSIDDATLDKITAEFTHETGKTIDTAELFANGWLRRVYQLIMLPSSTYSSASQARKIDRVLDTYRFLLDVKDDQKENPLTVEQLQAMAISYEEKHDCKLDLDQAKIEVFWQEKDGKISYGNLEYARGIYEDLDVFLYLGRLYDFFHLKEDDNNLYIEPDVLNDIIGRHKQAYPGSPDLAKLIENNVIVERPSAYIIHLANRDTFPADRIYDRTAAILWLKIRDSDKFVSDAERLRYWYLRIVHRAHWCDIKSFLGGEDLQVFLHAAAEAILGDSDLTLGEEEYQKIQLDSRSGRLAHLKKTSGYSKIDRFPIYDDLFILHKELLKFDRNGQSELFLIQSARAPLSYFIRQIVANEVHGFPDKPFYPLIMQLLLSSASKPYLLWSLCDDMSRNRPAVIPFLALNEQTASLGFSLLWKIELNKNLENKGRPAKLDLNKAYMQLVTRKLAAPAVGPTQIADRRKADILFQCLLMPTLSKFYTPYGGAVADQQQEKEHTRAAVTALRKTIEEAHVQYTGYSPKRPNTPLFYPLILPQLFESVMDYTEYDRLHNRTLSLPFYKLDYLIWLLHLANGVTAPDPALLFNISSAFLQVYLESINQTEVQAYDFGTDELTSQLPRWSHYNEGIEQIDWSYCCLALSRENLLEAFLSPGKLVFTATSNSYDEANRFTADKLRTHLAIMTLAHNALYNNIAQLQAEGQDVTGLLCVLEYRITAIVSWYCVQDEKKSRVDIFDNLFERVYFAGAQKKELLPDIGHTINKFSDENKRKIIRELLQADQLIRSLKLLEYLISEQDKQDLLASISTDLITKEIGKMNWYEEDYVLSQLAEYRKFKDKIMEVVAGLEQMIQAERGPWREASLSTFRIKLRLAYQDGNAEEIDRIEAPQAESSDGQRIIPASERDFYRGLLCLKNDKPAKAYDLFQYWMGLFEDPQPAWALNRFASKNHCARNADRIETKKKWHYEAVKEWNNFEGGLPAQVSLEFLKESIWYNKLEAWDGAQFDLNFDKQYFELEKVIQLHPGFLKLRIQNYARRNMHVQALMLLNEAERYHQLSNGNVPEFITQLREVAYTEKSEGYLRAQYDMIFSSPPATLVKIVHGSINRFDTLPLFILHELCSSAGDMLTYINSIAAITIEDKYSDLLSLSLRARLINYSWSVGPARGGFSASQKLNPGEIDFALNTRTERITICEAMRLMGKDITVQQSHEFKVFNYDPARKFLYMIVYYLGDRTNFQGDWEAYRGNCASVIKFPEGFDMLSRGWEDMPEFTTDTIKVGKTMHAGGCTLYHLFINICYLVAKTPGDKKAVKKPKETQK
jgi:hypothetical protein